LYLRKFPLNNALKWQEKKMYEINAVKSSNIIKGTGRCPALMKSAMQISSLQ